MFRYKTLQAALVLGALGVLASAAEGIDPSLSPGQVREIGEKAAIFGFPFVRNFETFHDLGADGNIGKFSNTFQRVELLKQTQDEVGAFGIDNSVSIAILDLRAGPVVLSVPAVSNRYYAIQLIDLVTDNFAYVGTRATGNRTGTFMISGPGWKGALPFPGEMSQIIPSPSWLALAIGRTQRNGLQDSVKVATVETNYRLQPLGAYYGKPAPGIHPMEWPPAAAAKTCSAFEFFTIVNFMMKWQMFIPEESPLLAELTRIGIAPGLAMNRDEFTAAQQQALEDGLTAARRRIAADAESLAVFRNGWVKTPEEMGHFETDYLLRAAVAWEFLYSSSPQEITDYVTSADSLGNALVGTAGPYLVYFETSPPVQYMWSISVLDPETRKVVGEPFRMSLLGKNQKEAQKARSQPVTIRVQRDDPGEIKDGAWLQVPEGPFVLLLRMYGPGPSDAAGTYQPPPIRFEPPKAG